MQAAPLSTRSGHGNVARFMYNFSSTTVEYRNVTEIPAFLQIFGIYEYQAEIIDEIFNGAFINVPKYRRILSVFIIRIAAWYL